MTVFKFIVKFCSHSVSLTADIEKAFLMISITPSDCDVLQYLWFQQFDSEICHLHLQFLGAVIAHHVGKYEAKYPDLVKLTRSCLHVGDFITGTDDVAPTFKVYESLKQLMKEAGLNLQKWNSKSLNR